MILPIDLIEVTIPANHQGSYLPYDVLILIEYLKEMELPVLCHWKETAAFEGTLSRNRDRTSTSFTFLYDMTKAIVDAYPQLQHQLQYNSLSNLIA
jgi:hypothetical protein